MDGSDGMTRRDWVRTAACGVAAGAAGLAGCAPSAGGMVASQAAAGSAAAPATQPASRPATPDEALQRLLHGNARFRSGAPTTANRTLARLQELGTRQAPFASILGCADSRVPVELVFDQGLGDLFVCRAAGNIATSEMIGSLEYGSIVLGSQLVVVLGHTACGAVSATVKGGAVPGQIGSLYPYIYPAIQRVPGGDLDAVIAENVRYQVALLRNASPVVTELTQAGRLRVVGAVFDFRDGRVTILD